MPPLQHAYDDDDGDEDEDEDEDDDDDDEEKEEEGDDEDDFVCPHSRLQPKCESGPLLVQPCLYHPFSATRP